VENPQPIHFADDFFSNPFNGINIDDLPNIILTVPTGSKTTYEVANVWKNFNIVEADPIAVSGTSLNKTSMILTVNETETLEAIINPENATNKNVTWTSSVPTVAIVENGAVTAIGTGTTTITVTTEDGAFEAICEVTVNAAISVSGINLNKSAATLLLGATEQLTATVLPDSATNQNVVWESSNTSVATVEDGVITAVGIGTATITVTTEDGAFEATCEVLVSTINVPSTWEIGADNPADMTATLTPDGTLTISGTGSMKDYAHSLLDIPWFDQRETIKKVIIEQGVSYVGVNTFIWCTSLTSIVIPGSVVTIGEQAFYDCSSLASITINSPVPPRIDGTAFTGVNIENITLHVPIGFKSAYESHDVWGGLNIVDDVEIEIIPVTSVALSETEAVLQVGENKTLIATVLPDNATNNNVTWTSSVPTVATVENGVLTAVGVGTTTITVTTEDGAFEATCEVTVSAINVPSTWEIGANNPADIIATLENGVLTISGNGAMQDFTWNETVGYTTPWYSQRNNIRTVIIESGVTHIGDFTFNDCNLLTSATIPEGITSIGGNAFSRCTSLTSVTLPEGVITIRAGAFYQCTSLAEINIPNSVTSIGQLAFEYCSSLISIVIPEGVTRIEQQVFANCSALTSITIPRSVTSIEFWAFNNSTSLRSITVKNPVPPTLYEDVFREINTANITLHVPIGFKSAYESYAVWGEFNIVDDVEIEILTHTWEIGANNPADVIATLDGNILTISGTGDMRDFGRLHSDNPAPWYSQRADITTVVIEQGVTSIGDNAFENSFSLTEITIPESVTSIGAGVFHNCTALTSINIPEGITSIEALTFAGCNALTSITIPEGVVSIGNYAFAWTGIFDITILNGVRTIGRSAFMSTQLTSVMIPKSVTSIEFEAFAQCHSLISIDVDSENSSFTSEDGVLFSKDKTFLIAYPAGRTGDYTIPESVRSIATSAFYGAIGLTSIEIPSSVTVVGALAFWDCTSLTEITFKRPTPPTFGGSVFEGLNTANITFTVPFGSRSAYRAIDGWSDFNIVEAEAIAQTWQIGAENPADVIATLENSVLTISGNGTMQDFAATGYMGSSTTPWYSQRNEIHTVIIEDGITNIGTRAFSNSASLTSVTISGSVQTIGMNAFNLCTSLTSIVIPEGVKVLGMQAFINCTSLVEITLPESLTTIGTMTFGSCTSLTSIVIPSGVQVIEGNAFQACSALTSVVFKSPTPPTLSGSVFAAVNIDNLTITVPLGSKAAYRAIDEWWNNFNIVEEGASTGQTWQIGAENPSDVIATLDESGTLTISGAGAMQNFALQSPAPWASLRNSIKNVVIENGVTNIGNYAFSDCESLISVTIPESVTSIGLAAFHRCILLAEVTLPSSLTNIGTLAFSNCHALTSIVIPESVHTIGSHAFQVCTALTSVIFKNPVPPTIEGSLFSAVNMDNLTFTVPAGTESAYRAIEGWSSFNIVEATVETISVTSVTLNETEASLRVGNTKQLTAVVLPDNATNKNVTWSSSVPTVATVDESGKVVAIAEGTTTITATTEDGEFTATCEVTVSEVMISVESVSLEQTSLIFTVGGIETLIATINPDNATNKNVTWSSSIPTVATVTDNGTVTALSTGTTTITVTTEDGEFTATCIVTVITSGTWSVGYPNVSDVTAMLDEDGTFTISGTGTMQNYSLDNPAPWSVLRNSIKHVVIENGVTNVGNFAFFGCAYLESITFGSGAGTRSTSTSDGITSIGQSAFENCTQLTTMVIPGTVVTIDNRAFANTALQAITIPESVTNIGASAFANNPLTEIVFKNPTPPTVAVDAFEGVNTDTLLIVVPEGSKEVYKDAIEVANEANVVEDVVTVSVESVLLNRTSMTLVVDETEILEAIINPENATNKNVSWSSSVPTVVTVDNDGKVVAIATGKATITVITEDGSFTATCEVTVDAFVDYSWLPIPKTVFIERDDHLEVKVVGVDADTFNKLEVIETVLRSADIETDLEVTTRSTVIPQTDGKWIVPFPAGVVEIKITNPSGVVITRIYRK
jgi:uncharacterized protein YjdB